MSRRNTFGGVAAPLAALALGALGIVAASAAPAAEAADGAKLFTEKCAMCHRAGGMGTVLLVRRVKPEVAELEKRADLTPQLIEVAVRTGIVNMPRLTRAEVSDTQLRSIADYLTRAR